jgi:hypothetical protein
VLKNSIFASVVIVISLIANPVLAAPPPGGGGDKVQLSDLGCGPDEIPRENAAEEWECSPSLTTKEGKLWNSREQMCLAP